MRERTWLRRGLLVRAAFDINYPVRRQEYLRVRLNREESGEQSLELFANQSSGVLTSASWADGFAVIREGESPTQGDLVEFIPFSFFDL